MLQLTIPGQELWYEDEKKRGFIQVKGRTIKLEHSLRSVKKWESKWKKPFISKAPRSQEEILSYIECMTLTEGVDPNLYLCLTPEHIRTIQAYIDDPMTATKFRGEQTPSRAKKSIPLNTNERIYAAMVRHGIPFECDKWHLNQLLTLIQECEIHGGGSRVSRNDTANYYAKLNAARRAKYHSKG